MVRQNHGLGMRSLALGGTLLMLGLGAAGCSDDGTPACETGYIRSLPCGAGGQTGTYTQACIDEQWIAKSVCTDGDGNVIQDGPQVSDENCVPGARRAGVCDDGRPGLRVEQCDSNQFWEPLTACIHGPDGGDFIPVPDDKEPNPVDPKDPKDPDPTGNDCKNFVEIEEYNLKGEVTLDGCYDVNKKLTVTGDLTIAPGTILRFAENIGLAFQGGSSIYAVGTEEKPIQFIGQKPIQGYWAGITISSSSALSNEIAHVIIDGGGYVQTADSAGLYLTTAYSSDKTSLVFRDSIIRNSGHYGIVTGRASEFTTFKNNKLYDNADGPAYLDVYALHSLDDTSTYGDKGTEVIRVSGTNVRPGTMRITSVPYLFENSPSFSVDNETLSIDAGVTLTFAENQRFQITNGGIIQMNGTVDKPVTFRGAEAIPGYWEGVKIVSTDRHANHLTNVAIKDAGKSVASLELTTTYSSDNNRIAIDGLTITNGKNAAVHVGRNSSVMSCKNVNFTADDVTGDAPRRDPFLQECGL